MSVYLCCSEIGETKQALSRCIVQYNGDTYKGQDSAVYLDLREKMHSFDKNAQCLTGKTDGGNSSERSST